VDGGQLTLLFPEGRPEKHVIYGELGLHRKPNFEALSRLIRTASQPEDQRRAAEQWWSCVLSAHARARTVVNELDLWLKAVGLVTKSGKPRAASRIVPVLSDAIKDDHPDLRTLDWLKVIERLCPNHVFVTLWQDFYLANESRAQQQIETVRRLNMSARGTDGSNRSPDLERGQIPRRRPTFSKCIDHRLRRPRPIRNVQS
jgi:hypothetical protein